MAITCTGGPTPNYPNGCALLKYYDSNKDGIITKQDALNAVANYNAGLISREEAFFVETAYFMGTDTIPAEINMTCPGCYVLYREAVLASCQWPVNVTAGQAVQVQILVNQGSVSENYKLVFSGDFTGVSNPFTVNAGTGQQPFSVPISFATGGQKSVTASLVKV